jgi:DNA-binding response OmpR family regulator
MGDAWIFAGGSQRTGEAVRLLAELGFSPRRMSANGSLRPTEAGDPASRRPDVALVFGDAAAASDLCARLRDDDELGEVPVLLTVEAGEVQHARGVLDAHELIVAPFDAAELEARIARARRTLQGVGENEVVRCGGLELNLATYQVTVDDEPIDFTYMEYELLKFLITHPRRVFSREALLSRVWDYDYYGGARTVDVHVRRVRAKLGSEHAARIKTVRSVGYRFED